METSTAEAPTKKLPLEDLNKEEIIEKYQHALLLLKKAKQSKDALVHENVEIKEQLLQSEKHKKASDEIIENLTQQKLNLVTSLEELKQQNRDVSENLALYGSKLLEAESKISELDTSNQSYKRQVNRLTDENEQLITHLDGLEKKIEEFQEAGLLQQQQLLELEKLNRELTESGNSVTSDESKCDILQNQVIELQKMLNISLEEVKHLKADICSRDEKIENMVMVCAEKDLNIVVIGKELTEVKKRLENTEKDINDKATENEELLKTISDLKSHSDTSANNDSREDKQKIEDLQTTNDKLRAKLKNYHSKMVKFAGDIKTLKNSKNAILEDFKSYTADVEDWKKRLNDLSIMLLSYTTNYEMEKKKLIEENKDYIEKIETLNKEIETIKNETLKLGNSIENNYIEKIECYKNESRSLNESILNLSKEVTSCEETIQNIKAELERNREELGQALDQLNEAKINRDMLESEKDMLSKELFNVKSQYELELQNKDEERAKLIDDISTISSENLDLKEKLNKTSLSSSETSEKLKTELSKLNLIIDHLKEENSHFESLKIKQNEEISHLSSQLCDMNKELSALRNSNEENSEDKSKLKEEISKLNQEIMILTNDISKLKDNELSLEKQCLENDKVITEIKEAKEDLQKELSVLMTEKAQLLEEKNQLEDDKNALNEQIHFANKQLRELTQEMLETNKGSHNSNTKLNEDNKKLLEEKSKLSKEIQNYEKIIEENNTKFLELFSVNKEIEDKLSKMVLEKSELEESFNACQKHLDFTTSSLQEIDKSHLEFVSQKEEEIKVLIQTIGKLKKDKEEMQLKLEKLENHRGVDIEVQATDCSGEMNYKEKIDSLTKENQELLSEMNEMNQALKERGETISQQQIYCEELLKKAQAFETQLSKHSEMLADKEKQITSLSTDLSLLKDKSQKSMEVPTCKESNELKQKEDIIQQLQTELQTLREKFNSNGDVAQENSYAESETMSTSTVSRADDINRFKDLEGSWEERYGKLRSLAVKQKGKIRDITAELTKEQNEKSEIQQKYTSSVKTVQSLQTQCDKLQDDLDASKKECNSLLKKLDTVASDIAKDKKMLANNEETITKLKAEIENINREKLNTENWKKQVGSKVQSLKRELEANAVLKKEYETQVKQLKSEIESKDKALKMEMEKHKDTRNSLLESNNECKKQTVLNLEMQDYERSIKDLSQKLEKKVDVINKLKNQLDGQKTTVNTLKDQNVFLQEEVDAREKELEGTKIEVNILKSKLNELDTQLSEKENNIQSLTENLEAVRGENEELSTQLSTVIAEHQKVNNALKNEKEYLRSQNLGLEQRLREVQENFKLKEDELSNVQNEYQGYKVRAQSVLRQNQTRDIGMEEKLKQETERMQIQLTVVDSELLELKNQVEGLRTEKRNLTAEKEKLTTDCTELQHELQEVKTQFEQLSKNHQQVIAEHVETVRGLKIHADTLSQCLRQQISEQEARHNREIIELQSKISKTSSTPEVPPLMLPSMPREEGEGSESVESSATSIHPIPLERLLSVSSDQETGMLKKQLQENESRVAHLTALLADTEQDLVKHVQMNKLLKEEIRRQQRSVEREQHAENLEYLKNVMFKFITLNNGDERTRLVPVLTTILKLSPEETQKLNLVAKSDKGWSNYLPLWSAQSKPQ